MPTFYLNVTSGSEDINRYTMGQCSHFVGNIMFVRKLLATFALQPRDIAYFRHLRTASPVMHSACTYVTYAYLDVEH